MNQRDRDYDLMLELIRDFRIKDYNILRTPLRTIAAVPQYNARSAMEMYSAEIREEDMVELKIPLSSLKDLSRIYDMIDKKKMSAAAREAFKEFEIIHALSRR